jgi:hypothetical protein
MKTIVYRGGVLKFRIPASWKEEYSDMDGGMFYESGPDTGTLRVKVITAERPADRDTVSLDELMELLLKRLRKRQENPLGNVQHIGKNALVRFDESSIEDGTRLRIFYWMFVNPVSPRTVRIVTFSYTVLDSQTKTAQLQRELELLDAEIVRTEFSSQRGR